MRRREFVAGAGGMVIWSAVARAQKSTLPSRTCRTRTFSSGCYAPLKAGGTSSAPIADADRIVFVIVRDAIAMGG
jgi:hypothetical protein